MTQIRRSLTCPDGHAFTTAAATGNTLRCPAALPEGGRCGRPVYVRKTAPAAGPAIAAAPPEDATWASPPAVPVIVGDDPGECPECGRAASWTPRQTGVICPAGHWALTARTRSAIAPAGEETRDPDGGAVAEMERRVELKAAVIADTRALDEIARRLEAVERAGHWQQSPEAGKWLAVILALRDEFSPRMTRAAWQHAHAALEGLKTELQARAAVFDAAVNPPEVAAAPRPRAIEAPPDRVQVPAPTHPRAASSAAATPVDGLVANSARARVANLGYYGACQFCIGRGERPDAATRETTHGGRAARHCRRHRKDALAELKAAAATAAPPPPPPAAPPMFG